MDNNGKTTSLYCRAFEQVNKVNYLHKKATTFTGFREMIKEFFEKLWRS